MGMYSQEGSGEVKRNKLYGTSYLFDLTHATSAGVYSL